MKFLIDRSSALTYGLLAGTLIVSAAVIQAAPSSLYVPSRGAFSWPVVAMILALGAGGLISSRWIGIPEAWAPAVSHRLRFAAPIAAGVLLGIVTALHAFWQPSRDPVTPWPYSVPAFLGGALLVELSVRAFAITTLAAGLALLVGRARKLTAYWIVAVLVAILYEPGPYFGNLGAGGVSSLSALLVILRLIAANLLAAWFYRRAGLLAPITLRLSDYGVWHIAWPLLSG